MTRATSRRPSAADRPSPAGPASFYISRLERLIRLRRDFEAKLNHLGVELLDRSIFATLRDCDEHGAGRQARRLMAGLAGGRGVYWGSPNEDRPRR